MEDKSLYKIIEEEELKADCLRLRSPTEVRISNEIKDVFRKNLDELRERYIVQFKEDQKKDDGYTEMITVYKVFEFIKNNI